MGSAGARAGAVTVGGWSVGPVLGRRPAGPVREAVEPVTGRSAVVVVVDERFRPSGAPDADAVLRAAGVDDPALPPLIDAGLLEDGTPWYVCDEQPGATVAELDSCSPRRAVSTAAEAARALAVLHAAGVAHGLVGPSTVLVAGGRHQVGGSQAAVLLDSGLAALVGDGLDALAAAAGVVAPVDRGPAADVHALGGLLLRMLTAAAPPAAALATQPAALRALLSAMLDPDPARRPTAGAAAARLAALQVGLPATGPVDLPGATARSAPAGDVAWSTGPAPIAPPAPSPPPVRRAPALSGVPDRPLEPARDLPGSVGPRSAALPAPLPAPVGLPSMVAVPRTAPLPPRALRTGPVPVLGAASPHPAPVRGGGGRRRTVLAVVGGVGGAALVAGAVAVVLHLPGAATPAARAAGGAAVVLGVSDDRSTAPPPVTSTPVAAATTAAATRPSAALPEWLRTAHGGAPLAPVRSSSPPVVVPARSASASPSASTRAATASPPGSTSSAPAPSPTATDSPEASQTPVESSTAPPAEDPTTPPPPDDEAASTDTPGTGSGSADTDTDPDAAQVAEVPDAEDTAAAAGGVDGR